MNAMPAGQSLNFSAAGPSYVRTEGLKRSGVSGGWSSLMQITEQSSLFLHVFNFTATNNNTNAQHGEQVVGTVAVFVHTAVESSRSILAKTVLDDAPAAGVVFHEVGDIVNEAANQDQAAARSLVLLLVCIKKKWSIMSLQTGSIQTGGLHCSQVKMGKLFEF